jgi:MFS family permease
MNHHLAIRTKIIIMLSIMASLFLVALDQTIVSTSLGRIVEEFNSYSMLSWVITSYMLTTTITVPIAGKLSDLFGRRIMTIIGIAVFVVGSLVSGLSGDMTQLVVARAIQGVGAGIITANAFTIIGDLFAGSGSMSKIFKINKLNVIANDTELYSYYILSALLNSQYSNKIRNIIDRKPIKNEQLICVFFGFHIYLLTYYI